MFDELEDLEESSSAVDYFEWDEIDNHPELLVPKTYFQQITNFSEQCYWETGLLPTVDKVSEQLGIVKSVVQNVFRDEKYRQSLATRGIDFDPTLSNKVLSPKQIAVANLLLNTHDKRSEREKLELVGVSSQQYHAWLRQSQFQDYLTTRAKALFGASDYKAFKALIRNVESGDNSAIRLFMEMQGYYQPRLQVDVNISVVLNSVVEIITRHVHDPAILEAIAVELENVIELPNSKAS